MIAASFVDEALEALRRRGLPVETLLSQAGLPAVVSEPVSAVAYGKLWLAISTAIDDEFFGLGGRPMSPGSFTLLCHCLLHATNLEQALRRALRFLRVVLDDPSGELIVTDGLAQIKLNDAGAARSAFAYRTFWIVVHGITCWLVGRRIGLRRVDFRCAEPQHCADYRLFFGAPVRFDQPTSCLHAAPPPAAGGPKLPRHQGRDPPRPRHRLAAAGRPQRRPDRGRPRLHRTQRLPPRLSQMDRQKPRQLPPRPGRRIASALSLSSFSSPAVAPMNR